MTDYSTLSSGDFLAAVGTDGEKWTQAYMQLHGSKLPVEGNLLGWFCNAIEAGRSAAWAECAAPDMGPEDNDYDRLSI